MTRLHANQQNVNEIKIRQPQSRHLVSEDDAAVFLHEAKKLVAFLERVFPFHQYQFIKVQIAVRGMTHMQMSFMICLAISRE